MKNRNFVNLNINPCKMCMPMGAVTAFKGIENCMVILHGSQGCSTYIRRHMATHYNEPVDIASSSLNEHGTVYGGEENLKKGLRNLVKQYNPQVIGVASTCLAETIGEDIRRITAEFMEEEEPQNLNIVPVSTPGYGGTQFEGYYAALTSIVKKMAADGTPNGRVNIIAGLMSPGDIRNIKRILNEFGMEYTLLPDISDTLDAPFSKDYRRMPKGGTRVCDIEKMAGAVATVEMGLTVPESLSPGKYLLDAYGVPLFQCSHPVGIRNTDEFVGILSKISQREIPNSLKEERGRLVDGMIDSHKYNAEGRAVIYGDPEQVLAVSRLCLENGIRPVLISTGTQNCVLKSLLEKENTDEKLIVIDDTDFETIQKYSVEFGANILLGNSDGKFITEKEGIPLLRIGFPIHDRVGGQRLVFTGYNGTMNLLDNIANTLLESKYDGYRKRMKVRYYDDKANLKQEETAINIEIDEKTKNHPCFTAGACDNARMHIPVAPACNISCNYCSRKFDCVNESRPGVTSEILTPFKAAEKFIKVKEKLPNLKVVGIAGPGDALANFEAVEKSIQLIKEIDPDITFCLSTNGLMLPFYADRIAALGVTHVTVTVNAVDPKIGALVYKEVNYRGRKLVGEEAARTLILNQLAGLKQLTSKGVMCKVNIVMVKGVNEGHIEAVVKAVKKCGAAMTNIMPLIPAVGSVFENMPLTSNKGLNELRKKCGEHIKQMYHCRQCRADAIGILGEDVSSDFRKKVLSEVQMPTTHEQISYLFAVATGNGMHVDRHFGHVDEFHLYKVEGQKISFMEKRKVDKYCTGNEDCDEESRIKSTIRTIEDCNGVLVLRIGYRPSKILEEKGIRIFQTCEGIEDGIRDAVKKMASQEFQIKEGVC